MYVTPSLAQIGDTFVSQSRSQDLAAGAAAWLEVLLSCTSTTRASRVLRNAIAVVLVVLVCWTGDFETEPLGVGEEKREA